MNAKLLNILNKIPETEIYEWLLSRAYPSNEPIPVPVPMMTTEKPVPKTKPRTFGAKRIRCIEDGKVFNSMGEAARFYKVSSKNVGNTLAGRQKTCAGKTFELIQEENFQENVWKAG